MIAWWIFVGLGALGNFLGVVRGYKDKDYLMMSLHLVALLIMTFYMIKQVYDTMLSSI